MLQHNAYSHCSDFYDMARDVRECSVITCSPWVCCSCSVPDVYNVYDFHISILQNTIRTKTGHVTVYFCHKFKISCYIFTYTFLTALLCGILVDVSLTVDFRRLVPLIFLLCIAIFFQWYSFWLSQSVSDLLWMF